MIYLNNTIISYSIQLSYILGIRFYILNFLFIVLLHFIFSDIQLSKRIFIFSNLNQEMKSNWNQTMKMGYPRLEPVGSANFRTRLIKLFWIWTRTVFLMKYSNPTLIVASKKRDIFFFDFCIRRVAHCTYF